MSERQMLDPAALQPSDPIPAYQPFMMRDLVGLLSGLILQTGAEALVYVWNGQHEMPCNHLAILENPDGTQRIVLGFAKNMQEAVEDWEPGK